MDFPTFRTALQAKDVATWLTFYTEDVVRVEDRHDAPLRDPHCMPGHAQTSLVLAGVAAADIDLAVAAEVIQPGRGAFAVTAILPGGRRIYEHVILQLRGDRVAHQFCD